VLRAFAPPPKARHPDGCLVEDSHLVKNMAPEGSFFLEGGNESGQRGPLRVMFNGLSLNLDFLAGRGSRQG